jgi:hypothetical protein
VDGGVHKRLNATGPSPSSTAPSARHCPFPRKHSLAAELLAEHFRVAFFFEHEHLLEPAIADYRVPVT